jgi:hypothetical protein
MREFRNSEDEEIRREDYRVRGGYVLPTMAGATRQKGYSREKSYSGEYSPRREEYKGHAGFRGSYSESSGSGRVNKFSLPRMRLR